ncbi:hypothetical protein C7I85_21740 [Mesorhizobium soli]|uniref:Uncharacterized protein n=1 Tax=Pseudaminobacter soli (ex Li et al. 2025) TaxID=1295366 RepID=A0A2P7S548_9HYPH|nr:hypothetical protein C7I85_21740 [Mesorhizobium soli]
MVAMLMCGDIHRQIMRLYERQVHKLIAIDFDRSGLPDELRKTAPVWVESLLKEVAPAAGSNEDSYRTS